MYELHKDKYFLVPVQVLEDFLPLLNFKGKQNDNSEMIQKYNKYGGNRSKH